jgi:hypothetical protein
VAVEDACADFKECKLLDIVIVERVTAAVGGDIEQERGRPASSVASWSGPREKKA